MNLPQKAQENSETAQGEQPHQLFITVQQKFLGSFHNRPMTSNVFGCFAFGASFFSNDTPLPEWTPWTCVPRAIVSRRWRSRQKLREGHLGKQFDGPNDAGKTSWSPFEIIECQHKNTSRTCGRIIFNDFYSFLLCYAPFLVNAQPEGPTCPDVVDFRVFCPKAAALAGGHGADVHGVCNANMLGVWAFGLKGNTKQVRVQGC